MVTDICQSSTFRVVFFYLITLFLGDNGLVATFSTCHWTVIAVLDKRISDTIANQDRRQLKRSVSVVDNLQSKAGDIMAGIRFSSNVELILDELRKLLEEQFQKHKHILSSTSSVCDLVSTSIRISYTNRLVQKDDRSVIVP